MRRTTTFLAVAALALSCGCEESEVEGVEVEYTTADGLTLSATYNEQNAGPTPTLILLHQPGPENSRYDWNPIWDALENRGYALLAPDLRSHGRSDSDGPWEDLATDPGGYPEDLLSWLSFLQDREEALGLVDRDSVGVIGMGTSGSLAAAGIGRSQYDCAVSITPDLETLAVMAAGVPVYDPDAGDDDDEGRGDDDDSAGDDDDDDDSADPAGVLDELDLHTIRYIVTEGAEPSRSDSQAMFDASSDPKDLDEYAGELYGVDVMLHGDQVFFSMVDWCDGRF